MALFFFSPNFFFWRSEKKKRLKRRITCDTVQGIELNAATQKSRKELHPSSRRYGRFVNRPYGVGVIRWVLCRGGLCGLPREKAE